MILLAINMILFNFAFSFLVAYLIIRKRNINKNNAPFNAAFGHSGALINSNKPGQTKREKVFYFIGAGFGIAHMFLSVFIVSMLSYTSLLKTFGLEEQELLIVILGLIPMLLFIPMLIASSLLYRKDMKKRNQLELNGANEIQERKQNNGEDGEQAEQGAAIQSQGTYSGNLLKKNKQLTWICLGVGAIAIVACVIMFSVLKNTILGVMFALVGICGVYVGCSAIANRSKICPECGECWGEEVDSQYMGSSYKLEETRITKSEYDTRHRSDGEMFVDKNGDYRKRQIVTTHSYKKTLQCPHCGKVWSVNEKKVEK